MMSCIRHWQSFYFLFYRWSNKHIFIWSIDNETNHENDDIPFAVSVVIYIYHSLTKNCGDSIDNETNHENDDIPFVVSVEIYIYHSLTKKLWRYIYVLDVLDLLGHTFDGGFVPHNIWFTYRSIFIFSRRYSLTRAIYRLHRPILRRLSRAYERVHCFSLWTSLISCRRSPLVLRYEPSRRQPHLSFKVNLVRTSIDSIVSVSHVHGIHLCRLYIYISHVHSDGRRIKRLKACVDVGNYISYHDNTSFQCLRSIVFEAWTDIYIYRYVYGEMEVGKITWTFVRCSFKEAWINDRYLTFQYRLLHTSECMYYQSWSIDKCGLSMRTCTLMLL